MNKGIKHTYGDAENTYASDYFSISKGPQKERGASITPRPALTTVDTLHYLNARTTPEYHHEI